MLCTLQCIGEVLSFPVGVVLECHILLMFLLDVAVF